MRSASVAAVLVLVLLTVVPLSHARYTQLEQPDQDQGRTGWQTWTALRDWMRPATNYIRESLPDKTPTQFAADVRDAAVDLSQQVQDHPVVQGVARVVRPVHQWVQETASDLGRTSFRDMFHSAKNYAQSADERVAAWLNSNIKGQLQQRPQQLADNIILH